MDTDSKILSNLRDVVSCNGLRNFADLNQMRQDTLERRLTKVRRNLSADSMASIYVSWLCGNVSQSSSRTKEGDVIVKRCCQFMSLWGIGMTKASEFCDAWTEREMGYRNESDAKQLKMRMFNVRDTVLQRYPRPSPPQKQQKHITPSVEADYVLTPNPDSTPMANPVPELVAMRKPSESPPLSLQRRNILSLTLDTKRDSWNVSSENTSPIFANLGRLGKTISPVPKSYRCRRCGLGGHLIKDCPTNSNPDLDLSPLPGYTCHLCGAQGDHYITSCPKDKCRTHSVSPRGQKRHRAEDHDGSSITITKVNEREVGRLSPYENLSNAGQDLSPQNKQEKEESAAQERLYDYPWHGGWASPPPKKKLTLEPTWGYPLGHGTALEEPMLSSISRASGASTELLAEDSTIMTEDSKSPMTPNAGYTPASSNFALANEDNATQNTPFATEPQPATPIEAYVTEKQVNHPAYGAAVVNLFDSHSNTFVNIRRQTTALELWEPKTV